MFGLGNEGNDLIKKVNDSKDFNDWEKSMLIQGLRSTEKSNSTVTTTLRSKVCDGCKNNPKNGGSGLCHCILGTVPIT